MDAMTKTTILERLFSSVSVCVHCGSAVCSHHSYRTLPALIPEKEVRKAINLDEFFFKENDGGVESSPLRFIDALEAENNTLKARIKGLTEGIERYLSGDYPNPRANRPDPCKHRTPCLSECELCDSEWFEMLLETTGEQP